jgi:membrane protease YdiL (CAAX protease family)
MTRSAIVTPVVFTGFFVCLSLPANGYVHPPWNHPLLAYVVYPALILLLLRANPLQNGLGIGNWRTGLRLTFLASIAVLISCFFFAKVPAMAHYYSAPRWVACDERAIALAEGRRIGQLVGWEFLFRGFLLFPLETSIGPASNLIQATLCAVTHMKKPLVELYGSFPFALLLGYLARRTDSIWYGVFVHWLLGFSVEAYVAIGKHGCVPFF